MNEQIKTPQVRLIDENGDQAGIVDARTALERAYDNNLDLVEVAPLASPPVCKILDYGKYKYKQAMKERESKKKQHVIKIKEIRFRPRIDSHDMEMKVNMARKFLEKGNKVKFTVMFRGRELAHIEDGFKLIDKVVQLLEDVGKLEKAPLREGRTIVAFITSK